MFLDVKKDLFENGDDVGKCRALQIGAVFLVHLKNVSQMGIDLGANLAVLNERIGGALEFPEGIL